MREIEQDGFITDEIYIQETKPKANALEWVSADRAKLAEKCGYPNCEDCICYVASSCTVPMVVSKQIWRITEDLITSMRRRLTDLETLVTDEILRSDKPQKNNADEDVNYTWNDYFGKENEE